MARVKNDLKRTHQSVVIDDADDRDRWSLNRSCATTLKLKKKIISHS